MTNCKFKVGDTVIGNDSSPYGITKPGWIGKVTKVRNGYECDIFVSGNYEGETVDFWVASQYFDPYNEEKIVITHNNKVTTATLYGQFGNKVTATARCAPEDEFDFRIGAEIAMGRLVDKIVFAKFNIIRVVFREGERAYSYKTRMQTAKVGMEIIVPVGSHGKEVHAKVVEIIPGAEYDGEYTISAMKEIDIVEVKYWTGRVVCTNSDSCPGFTVGKIYKVDNGKLIDDQGEKRPMLPKYYISKPEDLTANDGYFAKGGDKFIPIVE